MSAILAAFPKLDHPHRAAPRPDLSSTFGSTLSVHLLRSDLDGPRIVESRTSPLQVFAAPWSDLQSLLDAGVPSSPGFYILTRANGGKVGVRPGEAGDIRRRLLEHANDASKDKYQEVFAVTAVDGRTTKYDARFFEARVHEIVAAAAHTVLEVDKIPVLANCRPAERAPLETLLHQARDLLYAAGCRGLDAPRMQIPAAVDEADDNTDMLIVESAGIGDDEHSLSYDGLWSWGYSTADGGFVVRAGSDVRRRENSALLQPVADRRRKLAELGVLGEMPGVTDRWRLLCSIKVGSPLLAAKMVTGAHISNKGIWQRLAPSARLIAMDGR
nr:hypothetical protein [uncultured Devosia sp.]